MSKIELRNYVGMPLWRIARLLDAALTEQRAMEAYGFTMVSKDDVAKAKPPNLDGLITQVQFRKGMMTENAFYNLLADAS